MQTRFRPPLLLSVLASLSAFAGSAHGEPPVRTATEIRTALSRAKARLGLGQTRGGNHASRRTAVAVLREVEKHPTLAISDKAAIQHEAVILREAATLAIGDRWAKQIASPIRRIAALLADERPRSAARAEAAIFQLESLGVPGLGTAILQRIDPADPLATPARLATLRQRIKRRSLKLEARELARPHRDAKAEYQNWLDTEQHLNVLFSWSHRGPGQWHSFPFRDAFLRYSDHRKGVSRELAGRLDELRRRSFQGWLNAAVTFTRSTRRYVRRWALLGELERLIMKAPEAGLVGDPVISPQLEYAARVAKETRRKLKRQSRYYQRRLDEAMDAADSLLGTLEDRVAKRQTPSAEELNKLSHPTMTQLQRYSGRVLFEARGHIAAEKRAQELKLRYQQVEREVFRAGQ